MKSVGNLVLQKSCENRSLPTLPKNTLKLKSKDYLRIVLIYAINRMVFCFQSQSLNLQNRRKLWFSDKINYYFYFFLESNPMIYIWEPVVNHKNKLCYSPCRSVPVLANLDGALGSVSRPTLELLFYFFESNERSLYWKELIRIVRRDEPSKSCSLQTPTHHSTTHYEVSHSFYNCFLLLFWTW